jgi:hypothetical protein
MNRQTVKLLAAVVIAFCCTIPFFADAKDACYDCHGQKGAKKHVDRTLFEQSVHGFLACDKCHIDISGYPHRTKAKVNCSICHALGRDGAPSKQAQEYKLSVHGRVNPVGNNSVPTCQTCHGSHYIYPSADARSLTNRKNISTFCF